VATFSGVISPSVTDRRRKWHNGDVAVVRQCPSFVLRGGGAGCMLGNPILQLSDSSGVHHVEKLPTQELAFSTVSSGKEVSRVSAVVLINRTY